MPHPEPHEKLAAQYAAWPYPAPLRDISAWQSRGGSQQCDPSLDHLVLWPERPYNPRLSILIAGCGTNEAAIQAYNQPYAHVVGIDLSATSLAHQQELKAKHNLTNLELHQIDLHDVAQLNRRFDLVVSYGVVHHQSDPAKALRALAGVLEEHGVLLVSLYGTYLRQGVYMVQDALRRLRLTQRPHDVKIVRDLIDGLLPPWHPVRPYIALAHDLHYDAGLVDTFLHVQDRAFTVPDVLRLVEAAQLDFQGWFDNLTCYPDAAFAQHPALYQKLSALPLEEQWATVELLVPPGGHTFVMRKNGQAQRARITFAEDEWQTYTPNLRHSAKLQEDRTGLLTIAREWNRCTLDAADSALLRASDGTRTLSQIAAQTHADHEHVRTFFARMWRCGHILIAKASV